MRFCGGVADVLHARAYVCVCPSERVVARLFVRPSKDASTYNVTLARLILPGRS